MTRNKAKSFNYLTIILLLYFITISIYEVVQNCHEYFGQPIPAKYYFHCSNMRSQPRGFFPIKTSKMQSHAIFFSLFLDIYLDILKI